MYQFALNAHKHEPTAQTSTSGIRYKVTYQTEPSENHIVDYIRQFKVQYQLAGERMRRAIDVAKVNGGVNSGEERA